MSRAAPAVVPRTTVHRRPGPGPAFCQSGSSSGVITSQPIELAKVFDFTTGPKMFSLASSA